MLKTATFLLLVSACDLAAQRADTIVKTANRPVHSGVATLRREISIGVSDGDEKYMMGAIADVAVSVSVDVTPVVAGPFAPAAPSRNSVPRADLRAIVVYSLLKNGSLSTAQAARSL